jgi:hypothetical protein
MNGLAVVGCGIAGGVVGGLAAIPAMMFIASWDGLGVITWVPSGVALGAIAGVYVGTQIFG